MKMHPIVDDLIRTGVLVEQSGADVEVAPQYRETINEFTTRGGNTPSGTKDFDTTDDQVRTFVEKHEKRYDIEAVCLLIVDRTFPEFAFDEKLLYSLTMSKIVDSPSRLEGTPNRFWAIKGETLPLYQQLFDKAIVYVWKDDCPPCDNLKATFDAIPDEVFDGVVLLSIYGPGYREGLYEQYNVAMAPTTLFLASTRIDSRIVGPCKEPKLIREIKYLQNAV